MTRPRILRLLRIGWSAGCVVACLLLIALWVRSYSAIHKADLNLLALKEVFAENQLRLAESRSSSSGVSAEGIAVSEERGVKLEQVLVEYQAELWTKQKPLLMQIAIYYSVSLLCVAALAVGPWIRWHFSLRTLLIVTTLVAVVLGVIVWVR
jgi:hypothetical protein